MIAADVGDTVSQPAVMATSPARETVSGTWKTSGFFVADPCDQHGLFTVATAAARFVVTKIFSGAYNGVAFHADSRCTVENRTSRTRG